MPRILIVDDYAPMRLGVRQILESQGEWQVVGEAANGQQAVQLTRRLKPDVVIMDITMPGMSGFDATAEIMRVNPTSKVVILTMHEGPSLTRPVLRSGAKGLVTKSKAKHELMRALRAILAGDTYGIK